MRVVDVPIIIGTRSGNGINFNGFHIFEPWPLQYTLVRKVLHHYSELAQNRRFFLTPAPEAMLRFNSSRRRFAFASSVSSSIFFSSFSSAAAAAGAGAEGSVFFTRLGDVVRVFPVGCCRVEGLADVDGEGEGEGVASGSTSSPRLLSSFISTSSVDFCAVFFLEDRG
jgi:hypothetical protein